MSSQPATWDIVCYPNEDFSRIVIVENEDLSAANWIMQIRKTRDSDLIAELTTAGSDGTITATYDGTDTSVTFALPRAVTNDVNPQQARHSVTCDASGDQEYWFIGGFDFSAKAMNR